jgi:hypothetical protein
MTVRYSTRQRWDEHVTGSTVSVNMALTDVIVDSMTTGGENQCVNLFGVLQAVKDGSVNCHEAPTVSKSSLTHRILGSGTAKQRTIKPFKAQW